SAADPSTALGAMSQTGMLGTLLAGTDVRFVLLMIHSETVLDLTPDWVGRLVALGGQDVCSKLRLSKAEQKKYTAIHKAAFEGMPLLETAFVHGASIAAQAYLLQNALSETLPDVGYLEELAWAETQVFPVVAGDLMPNFQGPALGARLAHLKHAWIASHFQLGKEDLIALPEN
ncbi:MAG: CCA tRNA nucleotidyltransferase, partial [Sulfitobacter sp.]